MASWLRAAASSLSVLTLAFLPACGAEEATGEDVDPTAAQAASAGAYCDGVARLARDGSVEAVNCGIARGPKADKRIALVFTAGYFCEGGPTFLDTLAKYDAKASFFLLNAALKSQDKAAKCNVVVPRLISEGHYLGPHSATHPEMVDRQGGATKVTKQKFDQEMNDNVAVLRAKGVTGAMRYWIPPSETYNDQISAWSAERGFVTVHMNECPQTRGDYLPITSRGGAFKNDAIVKRVFECEERDPNGLNGSVLFFHLGVGTAREDADRFHHAFPAMMKRLTDDGYKFVRIDELLDGKLQGILPR